jgi:hypothetical protein
MSQIRENRNMDKKRTRQLTLLIIIVVSLVVVIVVGYIYYQPGEEVNANSKSMPVSISEVNTSIHVSTDVSGNKVYMIRVKPRELGWNSVLFTFSTNTVESAFDHIFTHNGLAADLYFEPDDPEIGVVGNALADDMDQQLLFGESKLVIVPDVAFDDLDESFAQTLTIADDQVDWQKVRWYQFTTEQMSPAAILVVRTANNALWKMEIVSIDILNEEMTLRYAAL